MRYKPFTYMGTGARSSGSFICASGGDFETVVGGFKYHIYSNVNTSEFSMSCNPSNDNLQVLVVGGGANGASDSDAGGGGGAGGVVFNQFVSIPTGSYFMAVGSHSVTSTFASGSIYSIRAFGAASGGGGNADFGTGSAAPFPGQGNRGGDAANNGGGGGGGVSTTGGNGSNNQGGNGGEGIYLPQFAILNTVYPNYPNLLAQVSYFFGGFPDGWYGGGGSGIGQGAYGGGGQGGGGYHDNEYNIGGTIIDVMDAIPNTGGGGAGGGTTFGNRGGAGARGMIIIRYPYI